MTEDLNYDSYNSDEFDNFGTSLVLICPCLRLLALADYNIEHYGNEDDAYYCKGCQSR